jgi:AcrR family transcriptional regulator
VKGRKIKQLLTFVDRLNSDMRKNARSSIRRRQPTQERAQETVNAILDAVIRLLRRAGSSSITTNRVAAAAGVSIGSVYQYFPNKRAIFIALHERHIEQVDQTLQRKISESADEPLERLVAHLMDGMIEVHAADPELATLLDSEVPHRADRAREFSVRLHRPLRDALKPHVQSMGGPAKLDLRVFLLANMLDALGHAVVLRRPPGLSQRVAGQEACRAILASLLS